MNQLSPGPHDSQPTGPDTTAGTAAAPGGNAAGNPAPENIAPPAKNGSVTGDTARNGIAKYDTVAGPFTIRDLTVFGSTLLMFVASLLPMFGARYNLWNLGNLFFLLLGIILPLVVVVLFVARRLQPGTIVRIGSLSVDQFASVTASFAFPLFFLTIANSFNGSVLLGLVGSVGLLAATVLAPHLPWLSADFKGRAETPAHVVAREAAVPSRKPAAPKAPKAPKPTGGSTSGSTPRYQPPAAAAVPASSNAPGGGTPAGPSPFAPPATYGTGTPGTGTPDSGTPGTWPSTGPEAPAVVHSADAKAAGESVPAAAAPSRAGASPATPTPQREEPTSESDAKDHSAKAPATAPETATTQHATQAPAAQQPAAQQPTAQQPWAATMATPIVSGDTRKVSDTIGATVDPASRPEESDSPAYEAFWFAVAQPRTAYDEHTGLPSFTIEPGGWVLALEDRGHEFLVQDTDGKVGVLRELSNIERG
ncbi:hypothetical protein FQP90_21090 [Paenarthrobacter nitroguajacolicus]|uniref:Uncharacterized protein n=1 Tax=Paenarthrobacter nitroguajacolicus TaxID=211146 RepID=A0A558GNZ3_PAENT|nr:hypothetical protein [Paenarthrobacter nitroguajacolicus]TVU58617.1 hypothetical protein FQP90_21090 [Paenarthrobacter nitroguajacolicus]